MNRQNQGEQRPSAVQDRPEDVGRTPLDREAKPLSQEVTPPQTNGVGTKSPEAERVTADQPAGSGRARLLVLPIVAAVLIAAGIWGFRFYQFSQTHTSTDDAYLTSDVDQVTPQVNGNLVRVLVADNQHVQAGQLLAVIDDSTFQATVDQAAAALSVAQAAAHGAAHTVGLTSETGNAEIVQAAGGVLQAAGASGSAIADVKRARAGLLSSQAGEQSALANVSGAEAGLQAARSARARAAEAVESARAQEANAQAAYRSAQATVTAARANADKASRDESRFITLYQEDAVSAQIVDGAQAAAKAARAQLEAAQQGVAQAASTVAQRQADTASAREQVRAADALITQTQAQLGAARQGVLAAQAAQQQASAVLTASQDAVGQAAGKRQQALGILEQARTSPAQVEVSRANEQTADARIKEAQAALETAQINLRRTRIYAAVTGVISKKSAEIGQQVAIGQPIMAVIPDNDVWVVANFKETQLRGVAPGQRAEIEVDTFDNHIFKAHVDSIAAATGATFALLPPDNATGNFTKVVQRLPVKLVLEPRQPLIEMLRAGLSCTVTIDLK